MPKFFVEPSQIFDEEIVIMGDDARHIALSLRMKVGDSILISDGNKIDYDCILTSIEINIVRCKILKVVGCESEPLLKIRLFQCLPKGEKMEYIVQKAVELGASEIYPVVSSRCIAKPQSHGKDGKDKKIERWNKIAYEAAQQSRRGIIPVVKDFIHYEDAVCMCRNDFIKFICYEDETGNTIRTYLTSKQGAETTSLVSSFFVGPEGGFSPEEIEYAEKNGVSAVSLGKRILRTETASGFVLSVLSYMTEIQK